MLSGGGPNDVRCPETPSNTCNFVILQYEVLRCNLEAIATEADFRPNELNTFPLK